MFNLLIKYTDRNYKRKTPEASKYIKTASTLTLGAAVTLIWKNIQIIPAVNTNKRNRWPFVQ